MQNLFLNFYAKRTLFLNMFFLLIQCQIFLQYFRENQIINFLKEWLWLIASVYWERTFLSALFLSLNDFLHRFFLHELLSSRSNIRVSGLFSDRRFVLSDNFCCILQFCKKNSKRLADLLFLTLLLGFRKQEHSFLLCFIVCRTHTARIPYFVLVTQFYSKEYDSLTKLAKCPFSEQRKLICSKSSPPFLKLLYKHFLQDIYFIILFWHYAKSSLIFYCKHSYS